MSGMKQAAEGLDIVPNLVLVDGNRVPAALEIPAQPVVKGDATSAASARHRSWQRSAVTAI